jgi:DNA-binding NtrC family response regulator
MVINDKKKEDQFSERDILYKVLFEMKNDVTEMKRVIVDLINNNNLSNNEKTAIITRLNNTKVIESENSFQEAENSNISYETSSYQNTSSFNETIQESIEIEESLSLEEREKELIQKALTKHKGRRKNAAKELGISERTLYRKIKEYKIIN